MTASYKVEQILENVQLHKYVSKPCPSTSVQLMKTQPLQGEFWLSNCWVCLLSEAQQDISRWGFRAFSLEAATMLWTWMAPSSRTKKNVILLATHPHDSVFRFKWPFFCCFIIKRAAFSGCRSIQIRLKGPGERLHVLYSRCQLRYTSLLQLRTMQDYCLCVSVLMCTHFLQPDSMQCKTNKKNSSKLSQTELQLW